MLENYLNKTFLKYFLQASNTHILKFHHTFNA